MAERDVDEQFAAIVAHWDDVALGLDPYGDPTRDLDEPDHPDVPVDSLADGPRETPRPEGSATTERRDQPPPTVIPGEVVPPANLVEAFERLDALPDSDITEPDGPDTHYVPPPPAPLPPSEDKHFWTMIAALVVGPVLFLYLLLFNRDGNGWWMMFALMVSIAGFVLLVLRQPLDRDEDDDGVRL